MQSDAPAPEPIGAKLHPIALLSIVDHHERTVGNKLNKRALGVLLGESNRGVYDITNAYAIPFEEEHKKEGVWFLDHDYHETKPQLEVAVDTERAAALGVSVREVGRTLETMMGFRRVTTYLDRNEEYDDTGREVLPDR